MTRPDDVVGYVFWAETYCGADIGPRLAEEGWPVSPAEVPRIDGERECAELAEVMLDELATLAEIQGFTEPIDREDESSFNSDAFPKVIFRDQADNDECVTCGQRLAGLPKIPTNVRS